MRRFTTSQWRIFFSAKGTLKVDTGQEQRREEEGMDQDKQTVEEILRDQIAGLRDANRQADMKTADIAVQEQYRRNAETLIKLIELFSRL